MKKSVLFCGCAMFIVLVLGCNPQHIRNAGLCGAGAGILGAVIDKKNPWRGAMIGAVIGSATCTVITELSQRAAIEAARTNRQVVYQSEGNQVRATPVVSDNYSANYNKKGRNISAQSSPECKIIKNEAWDKDGKFLGSNNENVCKDSNGRWQIAS